MPDTCVVGRTTIEQRFTDRSHGDLAVHLDPRELEPRRRGLAPTPWTWLEQVHGADVVVVERPGDRAGARADAAVTATPGATLAVHTADCAGVLLIGSGGPDTVIGAAHAGWRGLELGVLQSTVAAMRSLGAREVSWRLGPCISAAAYEFGDDDLARLARRLGPSVVATTAWGAPALDLRAGVAAALAEVDATPSDPEPTQVRCTATDPGCYSWRARAERGRQAALTWIDAA